jgi:hypothetical protein
VESQGNKLYPSRPKEKHFETSLILSFQNLFCTSKVHVFFIIFVAVPKHRDFASGNEIFHPGNETLHPRNEIFANQRKLAPIEGSFNFFLDFSIKPTILCILYRSLLHT